MLQLDNSGATVWKKTFGNSGNFRAQASAPASDGGYLIAGRTDFKSAGDYDAWFWRIDKNGNTLWDKTVGAKGFDTANKIRELANNTFAVAGRWGPAANTTRYWLAKIDAAAAPVWTATLPTTAGSYLYGLDVMPDGGLAVAGVYYSNNAPNDQIFAARADANGNWLWQRTYGGNGDEDGTAVAGTSDGGLAIFGDDESKGSTSDFWLLRTDPWGNPSCATSGLCASLPVPNCDDKKPCTLDSCDAKVGCVHTPIANCCATDADCSDGEKICSLEACTGGFCTKAYTGAPGCCNPLLLSNGFDSGKLDPFVSDGTNSATFWQAWQTSYAHSGTGAAYFGNAADANYDGGKSAGNLYTPTLKLPAGKSTLSFWLRQDTEISDTYDLFKVLVSGAVVLQPSKQGQFEADTWQLWTVDLTPYAGQSVKVQFSFDTVDDINNSGLGVLIDDVKIETGCGAQ